MEKSVLRYEELLLELSTREKKLKERISKLSVDINEANYELSHELFIAKLNSIVMGKTIVYLKCELGHTFR